MTLCFELTMDDLVAAFLHDSANNPVIKKDTMKNTLFVAMVAFAGFASIGQWEIGTLAGGACMVLLPWIIRRNQGRGARQYFGFGSPAGLIGPRELELRDDEMVSRTALIEMRVKFGGIEEVFSAGLHTYIRLCTKSFIVIPHLNTTKGSPAEFVAALRARMAEQIDRTSGFIGGEPRTEVRA